MQIENLEKKKTDQYSIPPLDKCKPFLKWAGGKRWLVDHEPQVFNIAFDRYFEPFLGGGAVFLHLAPIRAVLNDTNSELIDTYLAIREYPGEVFSALLYHQKRHDKSHYYKTRSSMPKSLILRAARFLYLNRTCFNGLYRVNLNGQFNVPLGTKNSVILDDDDFWIISEVLNDAIITCEDFEYSIAKANRSDFVFADPPYTVKHNNNGFIQYNERLFSWDDQIRLANSLANARARGAKVVATNANHSSVRKIYRDLGFTIRAVSRPSCIAGSPGNRGVYDELLITS